MSTLHSPSQLLSTSLYCAGARKAYSADNSAPTAPCTRQASSAARSNAARVATPQRLASSGALTGRRLDFGLPPPPVPSSAATLSSCGTLTLTRSRSSRSLRRLSDPSSTHIPNIARAQLQLAFPLFSLLPSPPSYFTQRDLASRQSAHTPSRLPLCLLSFHFHLIDTATSLFASFTLP